MYRIILLDDLFRNVQKRAHVETVLSYFLHEGLTVVLSTDNDGIWTIHKCNNHYHHISVSHEFCRAYSRGSMTKQQAKNVMQNSWSTRFWDHKVFEEKVMLDTILLYENI